jgi:short-subunit dehydrogenase
MATEQAGPRRRAFVTGGSAGIGAGFARALARRQYDLVLVARRRERLEGIGKELAESRGVEVEALCADLTVPAELEAVAARIEAEVPDLLVNNAGFGTMGVFAELDPARELEEVALNVSALLRLTRAVLPGMIARGRGAVINVSSMAAFQPMPWNATYAASKAFVNAFTEALHEEVQGTGVRVQALCPGFTRTEFQQVAGVDAGQVPDFAWMEVEPVVEASLAGLERGELVCVPGAANRVLSVVQRATPHALTRRLMRRFGARGLPD